jgi:hypothetical protein
VTNPTQVDEMAVQEALRRINQVIDQHALNRTALFMS